MAIDTFILILCSAAIIVLGLLIFLRNPYLPDNRRFAYLSLSLTAWIVFNYLSDNSDSGALLFTRLTFLAGVLAVYSLVWFIANFPNNQVLNNALRLSIFRIYAFVLVPVTLTPAFIKSIDLQSETAIIDTSYLYPLFLVYILFALILLPFLIRAQYKKAQTVVQRQHVSFVSRGIVLYAALTLLTNVLLPSFANNWAASRFGSVFTLLFVGMVAYPVVKHKMFDIQLAVARSLAYVFSLAALGGVFTILTYTATSLVFHENTISSASVRWTYTVLAIALAFVFPPVKRFFDRLTDSLFYRDNYNPQLLSNKLNELLVSSLDMRNLMHKSASIVADSLKPSYCLISIEESQKRIRIFGTHVQQISKAELQQLRELAGNSKRPVILADDLIEVSDRNLKEYMQKNDIAGVISLAHDTQHKREEFGFIIIGNKKSGNPYNRQDVRTLESVANQLVLAIQNVLHFEEIQKFNEVLQSKVDEATRKYRRTNEKLKALDETKDDFISMASHQLRTPLTSVKGYLSMVLEGDAGKINETQQKMLGQAFVSSQRMVYLIADLLNVSRLKTGKFVIEAIPVNLADMVSEEIDQLVETAAAREIELTYKKPKDFPAVQLDETKTRQVVMNFVDNAIYYTPAGGHIKVELYNGPTSVELKVVDDGIGVPAQEQHHLFTKFYRAGNARKARPDGTGLGLFMARKVILAQGGSVIFQSEEGKGSTFGFTFPKATNQAKIAELPVAKTAR